MGTRSMNWVFTLNNWTQSDEDVLAAMPCKYLVYGKEVGENGTPHLQGFVIYTRNCTFSAIQKKLPSRCHIEKAKGTPYQAMVYCKKDGNVIERGVAPLENKRKHNLDERARHVNDLLRAGKLDEVIETYPGYYHQRKRTIHEIYKECHTPVSLTEPCCFWIWGVPGIGKSRGVRLAIDAKHLYLKNCSKWWDQYDPHHHDYVLMDDFDSSWNCIRGYLKQWCDAYSFPAEFKGGRMVIRPRVIIITSNYHPERVLRSDDTCDDVTVEALLRRIKPVHVTQHSAPTWYHMLKPYVCHDHQPKAIVSKVPKVLNPVVRYVASEEYAECVNEDQVEASVEQDKT